MSTLAEGGAATAAAAVTAASASHVPTAASPSAVLQLSYEAAVSHPATAAPSDADATASNSSGGASAISGSAVQLDAESVAAYERILAAQGDCGVRPFFLNKYESEAVKNWDRCGSGGRQGRATVEARSMLSCAIRDQPRLSSLGLPWLPASPRPDCSDSTRRMRIDFTKIDII